MPFTLSHTVVAFPIHRVLRRLPLDALMVGATGPDLEYLYNLRVHGKYWHSFEGLILGAVPVCFILVLLWRKAVYQAILALLPKLRDRPDIPDRLASPFLYTVAAIVLGGLTHILWDSFTHYDGWGVALIPQILLRRLPLEPSYAWLQDISSLLGVIVLAVRSRAAYREYIMPLEAIARKPLLIASAVISALAIGGGTINALRWHEEFWGIILGEFAIGAMASAVAAIALASTGILVVRWWLHQRSGNAG